MLSRESIRDIALKNAYDHDGRADEKAVLSKCLAAFPEERKNARSLLDLVHSVVEDLNSRDREEIIREAETRFPEILRKMKKEQEHTLPDLPGDHRDVVMRLAPSPSGPLHLGHTRMAILNDEYVRRYNGTLILRIEDTNPGNIDPEAYRMIPEDLESLGVKVHKIVIQSSRLDLYYSEARSLIEKGFVYICTCERETAKRYKAEMKACPHRNTGVEENMEMFEKMVSGEIKAGEASAVVKTSLDDPNPSLRDWIAFRISPHRHPLVGDRYVLFPTMNFSVAVDDHHLKLTHVVRGRDQLNNTYRQRFIFRYNNWKEPYYFHYGMISYPGTLLKTSLMKKGIREGKYKGWDDVRLLTVRSLIRRGYRPETFRKYWVDSGLRDVDATFSWEIFDSINRGFVDQNAMRLFFVRDPVKIRIEGAPEMEAKIPFHPSRPDLGKREYRIGVNQHVYIQQSDMNGMSEGDTVRLKDLCNVTFHNGLFHYSEGQELLRRGSIIHWCPENSSSYRVEKPDGTVDSGLIEPLGKDITGVVQMERYGYVNSFPEKGIGYYTHR